ncbi:MAG TPA: MBL fold metallo-hydrolase [Ignavibacteriales bacterium]|nr:MBL fold metallo-hydrolase [Ignavibacteriales bacterium]HOL80626.1 MBL fold metallo-hydrolase [Ignavibacteriales bacterium]HOM64314.1 MBL fold metallo-hydrolase [Ignavibacteriales bacterium]HPD68026.1 MBL fold metallo-hydrolase [Ignavibacteriales bacterium]HPP33040.1 MBL fold metallo-hydrolase [Ignavibacteriales bacterium]
MKLQFWGVRGTIAVPGKTTLKYGGNTPCTLLQCSDGTMIILDLGTGSKALGDFIIRNKISDRINILISHSHWDHIQGIPYFLPFYTQNVIIDFYGPVYDGLSLEELIDAQLVHYFFPVQKDDIFKAIIRYKNLQPDFRYYIGDIKITTISNFHHGNTLGFKFEFNNKSIVYLTDNELIVKDLIINENFEKDNSKFIEFCKNADYLIHDCTYTTEDYPKYLNWGHSYEDSVLALAKLSKVKNLITFHYSPDYDDETITSMIERMKNKVDNSLNILPAVEGEIINL